MTTELMARLCLAEKALAEERADNGKLRTRITLLGGDPSTPTRRTCPGCEEWARLFNERLTECARLIECVNRLRDRSLRMTGALHDIQAWVTPKRGAAKPVSPSDAKWLRYVIDDAFGAGFR